MIRRVGDVLMYGGALGNTGWMGMGVISILYGSYDDHPPSDCQRRIEGKGFLSPGFGRLILIFSEYFQNQDPHSRGSRLWLSDEDEGTHLDP